jgi:hypothetical protein
MAPTPFVELSCLLFSEKRPGELATRKLLVELLTLLTTLPPASHTSPSRSNEFDKVRSTRETSTVSSALDAIPATSCNFTLLFTLLHNLRDPTQEAVVDFITATHAPRPFKAFVAEFININRDYFWVFCHSNRFWSLGDINVDEVECPKVPGGMTGGVEFEAMAYLTSLFRLLNNVCSALLQLARRQKTRAITHDFHSLLFSSGMDRALATTRKASQVYYQTLHLEMARYFDYARQSDFPLPVELEAWQSTPRLLTTEHRYHERGTTQAQARPVLAHTSPAASNQAQARTVLANISPAASNHPPIRNESKRSSDCTKQLSTSQSQASMVGSAIRKWENLATEQKRTASTVKHQSGGLGLGWAPSR